jgi:hypothetical protein
MCGVVADEVHCVLPHLDERQQRLVLAGEARSLGHRGIAAVAQASGASRSRICQGVAELEAGRAPLGCGARAELGVPVGMLEPTRRGASSGDPVTGVDPDELLLLTTR